MFIMNIMSRDDDTAPGRPKKRPLLNRNVYNVFKVYTVYNGLSRCNDYNGHTDHNN